MGPNTSESPVKWLRRGLLLLELAMLVLGIWGIIVHFQALDAHRLAGVYIIALVLYALAIFGVYTEMVHVDTMGGLWRLFGKLWAVILLVVVTFCGGVWLLIVGIAAIWPSWLPGWLEAAVVIIAFTWLVAGLIKFYQRAAEVIDDWAAK